ncbi:MAG: hypothetical protein IPL65_13120 [Lewinellaceae bacterium]|nr:hypothetical protein [Lewinellaceae bacterium]
MRISLLLSLMLTGNLLLAQSDQAKLEKALFNLPDVSFRLVSAPGATPLQYELLVQQPLDHQHPEKGHFYQLAMLTHHGFDQPTVMNTQGYQIHLGKNEIEAILTPITSISSTGILAALFPTPWTGNT